MSPARPSIGFVGLGAMGLLIAERLLAETDSLSVYDVRDEPIAALVQLGANGCASPAEVASRSEVVFVSLPNPQIVAEVASELATEDAMKTYVDLSTTGPAVAQEVAVILARANKAYLDAPVSGGPKGAREGKLTIMAAGDKAIFSELSPLLEVLGSNIVHVGETPGQGQLTKLLNNLMSATAIAITAEAVSLGVKGGLDPALLLAAVNASSGRNTASADKFPRCVLPRTFDFGFRMNLMTKDVNLCLQEADRQKVPMLLGSTVQQLWELADVTSEEGADCTAIAQMFEQWAGVTIKGDKPDAS